MFLFKFPWYGIGVQHTLIEIIEYVPDGTNTVYDFRPFRNLRGFYQSNCRRQLYAHSSLSDTSAQVSSTLLSGGEFRIEINCVKVMNHNNFDGHTEMK